MRGCLREKSARTVLPMQTAPYRLRRLSPLYWTPQFLLAAAWALSLCLGMRSAAADAAAVGPLVKESVATVSTQRGALVAVALPHASDGLTWRLARSVDPKVLRQVSEADVDKNLVVVFEATGSGTTRISYALTRGETPNVHRAVTQVVRVR